MKIRALVSYGKITKGEVIEAIVNREGLACAFDNNGVAQFFRDNQYEHEYDIEDENQEIIDRVEKAIENIDEIQKVYGNKYTLSELRELKELFRC